MIAELAVEIKARNAATLTTIFALLPVLMSSGRGADVARAMALPVFGGMLVEPFTTFIVPAVYCGYMEFKMRLGLRDPVFADHEDRMQEKIAA